jgi:hypothetical protein
MNQIKLESSELDKLKSLHSVHSKNVKMLAQTEVDISRLNKRKEDLVQMFETSEAHALHFEADLSNKYNSGEDMRIDIHTGNVHLPND